MTWNFREREEGKEKKYKTEIFAKMLRQATKYMMSLATLYETLK